MNGALAGLIILAVGDSHMVYMASPLHEALGQEGAVVNAYGMCGAMPGDWLTRTTTQCSAERHDTGPAIQKNQSTPSWLLTDLIAAAPPPVSAPQPAPAPAVAEAQAPWLAQLHRLGELHDQGVLSDAAFAAAKQRLLDQT